MVPLVPPPSATFVAFTFQARDLDQGVQRFQKLPGFSAYGVADSPDLAGFDQAVP